MPLYPDKTKMGRIVPRFRVRGLGGVASCKPVNQEGWHFFSLVMLEARAGDQLKFLAEVVRLTHSHSVKT